MLPSILRLDTPLTSALRAHVLAGDGLAVARDGALLWLSPVRIDVAGASGGRRRLSFVYGADGETLTLTLGVFAPDIVEAVLNACRRMSMAAVDRRWRPTLSRLGRLPEPGAQPATAVTRLDGSIIAAARRAVHPSYLLDRMMLRQRALAVAAVETLLAGKTEEPARRIA